MEPEGISELWDAIVDGNRSASEGWKASGVGGTTCFLTAQSPILMSCSSHTEACNALGTTDGVTSHC